MTKWHNFNFGTGFVIGDNEGTVTFIINKQLTGCGSRKLDGAIRIIDVCKRN